jgi:hypothetical protein
MCGQGLNHLPAINAHAKETDHGDEEEEEGQEEEVILLCDVRLDRDGIALSLRNAVRVFRQNGWTKVWPF